MIAHSANGLLQFSGGLMDGCCCELVYALIPCPDQVGARTDYYIRHGLYDYLGGVGKIVRIGLYCYSVGGPVNPAGLTEAPGVFGGGASCSECMAPLYPCVPNSDGEFSNAELEAMYPDIIATPSRVRICTCYVGNPGPGGEDSTQFTDNGINGHQFRLVPGPLSGGVGGHCRTYLYSSTYWPDAGEFDGDALIFGTRFFGTTDCTPGTVDTVNQNRVDVSISFGLCCDSDGWHWTGSADVAAAAQDVINIGGSAPAPWFGTGGLVGSLPNGLAYDGTCVVPGNPAGDGSLDFVAVAPGV